MAVALTTAAPAQQPALPKVILIGDSIRLGYAPFVVERLRGRATVVSPEPNGADSANVLRNLEEWVIREKPDVVHLNCGLHDLKLDKATKRHQVPQEQYEANLRRIVDRIRTGTAANLVFASTTPIQDELHARRGAGFDRVEADVARYNTVAHRVMRELGVPIHDLHWLVVRQGTAKLQTRDGTHYTPAGCALQAEAVTDVLLRQLSVRNYPRRPGPEGGAAAAEAYRKSEAGRDGQVPERFKKLAIPEFPAPTSRDEWNRRRAEVRRKVLESLGDLPPRPAPQQARVVSREIRPGYALERVEIPNGVDGEVSALLLVPEKVRTPAPAILWLHSSTPDKNQVITPNTNGGEDSLGEAFVKAGYVVLAPDAYWHGDRVGTGPAGTAETLREEQESLHKLNLWMGRTLWGMFVRDDQIALDYLCSRPEVDATRIGATGMSMGSTRAWWLAAVDERVTATVAMACLTRYQNLIRHGQLRAHGVYYFTYGLLKHFDTEAVLSLIAPRAFLGLTGELDSGSPADGIQDLVTKVRPVYEVLGAADRFANRLYPEVPHTVTPTMRAEMLAWFQRWLRPQP